MTGTELADFLRGRDDPLELLHLIHEVRMNVSGTGCTEVHRRKPSALT